MWDLTYSYIWNEMYFDILIQNNHLPEKQYRDIANIDVWYIGITAYGNDSARFDASQDV